MDADPSGPSPAASVLSARHLAYSYAGRFPALADVSLDVAAGERVALLGANGCGKSTLLKVLAGLILPDSGTLNAFGSPVTEESLEDEQFSRGFRSRIGVVFQNADAQVFSPTVTEEVAFGCLQLGLDQESTRHRVGDVLAMLDIEGLADRAPYQLSGGQKKKVAIASVLVMNPDVLLFDEPTAGLDPRTQSWLIQLLRDLHGAGKAMVLATHDLDTLDQVADRCIVFAEDHTVAREGPAAAILADRPLLLGVNLIHRHVHRHVEPGVGAIVHAHEHGPDHHG